MQVLVGRPRGLPGGAPRLAARTDQVVLVAGGADGYRRQPLSQGRLAGFAPTRRAQPAEGSAKYMSIIVVT